MPRGVLNRMENALLMADCWKFVKILKEFETIMFMRL